MGGKEEDIVEGQRLLYHAHVQPFTQSEIILASMESAPARRGQERNSR
nr:A78 [uncultured bacterium]